MKYLTDNQDTDAVNFISQNNKNDISHHEVTVGDSTSFYLRVQNHGSEPAYRTNVFVKSAFTGLSLPTFCTKGNKVKHIIYIFSLQ